MKSVKDYIENVENVIRLNDQKIIEYKSEQEIELPSHEKELDAILAEMTLEETQQQMHMM